MALDNSMASRSLLMALVMVWLYAAQSMGQTTPGTILTSAYFNKILADLPASCPGKGFYTYNGIIRAAQLSNGFGTTGSVTDRKREVAAFFANVMHETGGINFIVNVVHVKREYLPSTIKSYLSTCGLIVIGFTLSYA